MPISLVGPSRHIAVNRRPKFCTPKHNIASPRDLGRYQSIAEVDGQPSIAEDGALDPSRHFAAPQHGVAFGVKRTVEEMTAIKQAMAENRLEDVPTDTVGQEPNACAKSCQAPTAR